MIRLGKHAARIVVTILLGGVLGATLVRIAPGFGVDESELDSRLNDSSVHAIRAVGETQEGIGWFYIHHIARMVRGDLGTSRFLQRPVSELLKERAPETAKSLGLGLVLAWITGLGMALAVVVSRSWGLDFVASTVTGILLCLPAAVVSVLFALVQAPVRLILGLVMLPHIFRFARNLLLQSAGRPHVLMAHAKGLGRSRVLLWHVLVPSAPQLLALGGVSVSMALTVAIPIEALCDLPGLGQLAWKAALGRDLYLLVNLTMLVTLVTLLANCFSDLVSNGLKRQPA